MSRKRLLTNAAAGVVVLAFVIFALASMWAGRSVDSTILLVMTALVIGAGYHLFGDSMGRGVDDAAELTDDGGDGE
jgi:hypothetical protein